MTVRSSRRGVLRLAGLAAIGALPAPAIAQARFSGVLAVVAAGIVRGRYSPEIVSAEMRIIARSAWNLLVFLLNSLVFILIGLQLSDIVSRLEPGSTAVLLWQGVLLTVVAIVVRFAWIHPAAWLSRAIGGAAEGVMPEKQLVIMSWCGMRGIVSLAAALLHGVAHEVPIRERERQREPGVDRQVEYLHRQRVRQQSRRQQEMGGRP